MELGVLFLLLLSGLTTMADVKTAVSAADSEVRLQIEDQFVVVDNGIFNLTLTKPGGIIYRIQYKGVDNLLTNGSDIKRGYWDLVWSDSNVSSRFDVIEGRSFEVIKETKDQVELSFKRSWNYSLNHILVPLNIDKRFVVLRGSSGFHSYAIYDHPKNWPWFDLVETRIALKLNQDKFHYMAMDDSRFQRMPRPEDRDKPRAQPLAFIEAVLLVDPTDPELKGVTRVDDKYQFSQANKDNRVHGWISDDPSIGIWQITPSYEFRAGGPMKQELTSHVGPTLLASFHTNHYAGGDLVPHIEKEEAWKKVYGPVFFYLNSDDSGHGREALWDDAKRQMKVEVESWPYDFPASEDFLRSHQRGSARGRLLVKDRYVTGDEPVPANGTYIGLAPPGEVGSWQTECKSYQFWNTTDSNGYFTIKNVRPGTYDLYSWVPGFIGDYKSNAPITITPGRDIDLGELVFEPPRDGPTLWEIGIPDRSALEFFIPDPNPIYQNKFLRNPKDRFRQYGLWERYRELYSNGDPIYNVALSDYKKDWFFVHGCQRLGNETFSSPTWGIKFNLSSITKGTYKLRVAIAGGKKSSLEIHLNSEKSPPLFQTGKFGDESVIPRHGIHGLYRLFSVDVQSGWLVRGENTIFLTLITSCTSPWKGHLYDYIRLEAPPS